MPARILEPTPANVRDAARTLARGGIVGMPTETVYGLAGIAFDEHAVASIFAVKERPTFDPLIVHVSARGALSSGASVLSRLVDSGLADASPFAADARRTADRLLEAFWPGPFTLVLPRGRAVPDLVTSGLDTVAIRMPRHPVAQALIEEAGAPLAAPSANRYGRISPTRASDVVEELGDRIDIVLDGGACEVGVESTVVALSSSGEITLLRPGGVDAARIELVARRPLAYPTDRIHGPGAPAASPGMLEGHYAPSKRLVLLPGPVRRLDERRAREIADSAFAGRCEAALLVVFGDPVAAVRELEARTGLRVVESAVLSREGHLEEAARSLFATLRRLDGGNAGVLVAEPCPVAGGLGHAITDRLRRAAARPAR